MPRLAGESPSRAEDRAVFLASRASGIWYLHPKYLTLSSPSDAQRLTPLGLPPPQGPFSVAKLRKWLAEGQFYPDMPVYHIGAPDSPLTLGEVVATHPPPPPQPRARPADAPDGAPELRCKMKYTLKPAHVGNV